MEFSLPGPDWISFAEVDFGLGAVTSEKLQGGQSGPAGT